MFSSLLIVFWLTAMRAFAAVQHGTIGYGINMFRPFCCTACADSLAMVYLNCTIFREVSGHGDMEMKVKLSKRMDMEMEGETSVKCYASNPPYQQSLAYCIKSYCDTESVPYEKQNDCFQNLNSAGSTGPSLEQSLPVTAPTKELAMDAEWLNTTMLVNANYWRSDRGTIDVFAEVEKDHVSWSIAIFVVSIAIPMLTGAYMFITSQLPLSRRHNGSVTSAFHSYLALPALKSKRHSEPLAWKIGYLPSRAMTLWIILYLIVNILASSVGFRSVQPNTWYATRNPEIAAYVGNRAGVLSFANMALATLFAARNNPLLYLSGWDQTTQLTFHRWAARVAILQAIIHSVVYTADYVAYKGENTFSTEAAKPYFWWGIIATTAMGLMIGFSALPLRAYAYEFFLISHIILVIITLLGCWYHIAEEFSKKWGYEVWLYIAFAFWSYDRLVRIIKTVYYSLSKRPVARLEAVVGTNAVMMTILLRKPLRAGPGKHTYVHFPSSAKFWESHPFTICDWDEKALENTAKVAEAPHPDLERSDFKSSSNSHDIVGGKDDTGVAGKGFQARPPESSDVHYVRCLFRAHKGMTSLIQAKLLPDQALTLPIAIEGTYGGHHSSHFALHMADTVLCIAGGVGITFVSGFARQFARDSLNGKTHKKLMPRCNKFVLAWSVREENLLTHCKRYLLPHLQDIDDSSMQYLFWLTGNSEAMEKIKEKEPIVSKDDEKLVQQFHGRMDVNEVVGGIMETQKRLVVLVCGPGSLSDDVRAAVTRYSRNGFVVDFIEENFSW